MKVKVRVNKLKKTQYKAKIENFVFKQIQSNIPKQFIYIQQKGEIRHHHPKALPRPPNPPPRAHAPPEPTHCRPDRSRSNQHQHTQIHSHPAIRAHQDLFIPGPLCLQIKIRDR